MGTPEESGFGYHLPSPLEDDVFFDPGVVDKEVCSLSIEALCLSAHRAPSEIVSDSRCYHAPHLLAVLSLSLKGILTE